MSHFDPDRSRCGDLYDLPEGTDPGDISVSVPASLLLLISAALAFGLLCAIIAYMGALA